VPQHSYRAGCWMRFVHRVMLVLQCRWQGKFAGNVRRWQVLYNLGFEFASVRHVIKECFLCLWNCKCTLPPLPAAKTRRKNITFKTGIRVQLRIFLLRPCSGRASSFLANNERSSSLGYRELPLFAIPADGIVVHMNEELIIFNPLCRGNS
jgi:hypothetical protein